MANEVLVSYIKKQLDKNISQDRVRQALVAAKWREQDIIEAFDAINKASAPVTPPPVVKPVEPVVAVTPKIEPVAPKTEPIAPKVEPIVPKVEPVTQPVKPIQPEPPIVKTQPVTPPVQPVAPVIPKPAPVQPVAPKVPEISKPQPVAPSIMPKSVPPVQSAKTEVTTSDLNYEPEKSSSGIGKMLGLIVVIILIAIGIYFGFNASQQNNIKKVEQSLPPVQQETTTAPAVSKTPSTPADEQIKKIASAIMLGSAIEKYNDTNGLFPTSLAQIDPKEIGNIVQTGITYKQLDSGKNYELCVDFGTNGIKCAYSDPAKNESANSLVSYMQTMPAEDSAKIMQYLIPAGTIEQGISDATNKAKDELIITYISQLATQAELARSNDDTYIKFAGKACKTYNPETIALCADLAKEIGGTASDMQKYIVGTLDGKGFCIKAPLTVKYQDKQDYYCFDSDGNKGRTTNTNVCTLKDQTCGTITPR